LNNFLLNYFFKISSIDPTPQASTAFLNQVAVVVKPNGGGANDRVTECINAAQVAAVTNNTNVNQLFAGGVSKIFVIQRSSTLDLASVLNANLDKFFTVLITEDFTNANVQTRNIGNFKGVVGISDTDNARLKALAATQRVCAFKTNASNKSKNMMYAFGKLLSATRFRNQQYIPMPFDDGIDTLAESETQFDNRVSFVMNDQEFGKRLGLFAAGRKAIVAPYIEEDLRIKMQSRALRYVSANQPQKSVSEASLIEEELQSVLDDFISRNQINDGTVSVTLGDDDFVVDGAINIAEPTALWRISGELRKTL